MAGTDAAASPRVRRDAGKRGAIVAGALTVFARDGYTRASIDAISTEAGVSTRTIYNHFRDKADLFEVVIHDSAAAVAEAQLRIIDTYLRKVTDLETDLVEFARAWVSPMPAYAEHSALVRQVNAEAGHIPPAALETWQRTGPRRVLGELAVRLGELADRGLLRLTEPELAAYHFAVLTAVPNPSLAGDVLTGRDPRETVVAGVRVFLGGYRA